ncbi:MAG: diguanylate cyclase [Sphingomonadales bacterium]|nr:diguanylate cyclase [Sphingomonadales bacterium]
MGSKLIHTPGILRSVPVIRTGGDRCRLPDLPALPARWWCDLSDDSLRWDSGVFDLFGIPRGDPLDRREILGMYAGHSRTLIDRVRHAAIMERGSFTLEAEFAPADGGTRWIRIVADTVVSNGRVTHLYGTKCDITREVVGSPQIRPGHGEGDRAA